MIDEKLYKYIKKITPDAIFPAPFVENFNLKITKFNKGFCSAEVKIDANWTNPYGIAHGGILFTLLDEILGTACCSMLADSIYKDMKALSTTNHNIFFHSPALPGDNLVILGRVVTARKNMIFVEGHIERKLDKTLIADSKGTWFIIR